MPSERQQAFSTVPSKRPRQDPVSCSFCRSKKLKCDRQSPCFNCSSRSLACENRSSSHTAAGTTLVDHVDPSVLARLKRLEDIVLGQTNPKVDGTGVVDAPTFVQQKTTSSDAWLTPASDYEEAVHSLEEIGTRDVQRPFSSACQISMKYVVTPNSLETPGRQVLSPKSYFLPSKEQAVILLGCYKSCVGDLQHVIYIPRIRSIIDSTYFNLDHKLDVAHSHVALLLSIFASTAALCTASSIDVKDPFLKGLDGAMALSIWAHAALEILENSRCIASGSLEDVQASILLGFLLYHIQGFSARPRTLVASAIAIARDMSMHKTDVPASRTTNHQDRSTMIETEIKRRVWWYLVSTDWLLALNGGPREGTCFVHPRQMRVNWPLNIDDDDLAHCDHPHGLPLSEYTAMSYFIQRIRLGEICRKVVDVMPISNADIALINYKDIITIDNEFKKFFDDLPVFLRTDEESRHESAAIAEQHPHLKAQRCGLGMMAHVRRCRLHQPFLTRNSVSDQYSYSREISLESARTVIQMKTIADQESGINLTSTIKSTWLIHHVFLATIVLVMDLCFHDAGSADAARKSEVSRACRLLESAGAHSSMAAEYLDSLMDVLRSHNRKPHDQEGGDPAPAPAPQTTTTSSVTDDVSGVQADAQVQFSDFDEIWNDFFEFGSNMDLPEWDSLFSDLDSRQ